MNKNSFITTRKRLLIVAISITFLFFALMVRLFFVQVIDGRTLTFKANEQWHRDLPLKAKRGDILDRSGNIIVDSKEVFTIYVRPRAVKDVEEVSSQLSLALNLDKNKLYNKIKEAKVGEITVKKSVDFDTGNRLRLLSLEGVYFSVDSARNYPYPEYLAQVLGYTNADNEGQNGIEGYYDRFLRGTNGVTLTQTDNKGVELEDSVTKFLPPIDGATLTTTLDINIQGFVQSAVRDAINEWNAKSVNMLVMDVNNGGIVAMAQVPSYSLNDLPRDNVEILNAYSKNTMITDVYEPGSTFKIFTTAAAIESGVVSERNRFYCAGNRIVDGQRIKCWRSKGHGSQDLSEGVQNSCNCVFMDLALSMGTEKFYEHLRHFGFGTKTGVDFYSESNGLLMKESVVKTVDLARIGFGQAVAVTPLQLISGVSAVVNGGVYHTPHFVSSISDNYGNKIYDFLDNPKRILSESTSNKMRELLESVVSEGSGKKAMVDGYKIGGKTGTAQKYENGSIAQGKYVSSFVGFAPAQKPKYAILMTINEPNSYAYYGSIVAAPYVGQVFSKIFEYEKVKPTEITEEKVMVEMPYLDDFKVEDAIKILDELGILYEIAGEGDRVVSTVPIAGEMVEKGDLILIRS